MRGCRGEQTTPLGSLVALGAEIYLSAAAHARTVHPHGPADPSRTHDRSNDNRTAHDDRSSASCAAGAIDTTGTNNRIRVRRLSNERSERNGDGGNKQQ